MTFLKWLIFAVLSIVGTIASYLVVLIAARYIDENGNLKYLRSWLQTSDNPATGDPTFWPQQHPTYSPYRLAVSWLWRNPSQGLDQLLKADVTMNTMCTTHGNIESGNYLITCNGAFHLSYRLGIATGGIGWRLNNIVQGYEHKTMGQIVCTPIRFHK